MNAVTERRVRRVLITTELLAYFVVDGERPSFTVTDGVPADAELVDIYLITKHAGVPLPEDENPCVCMIFAHPSWEPVDPGGGVPIMTPQSVRQEPGTDTREYRTSELPSWVPPGITVTRSR